MSSLLPDLSLIRRLAPDNLPNFREERYRGGRFSVKMNVFSPDEQAILRGHYEQLLKLLGLIKPKDDENDDARGERVWALAHFVRNNELVQLARQFEILVREAEDNGDRDKAALIRRIASGAFVPIVYHLEIIHEGGAEPEYVQTLFYLTRDHLKSVRSFITDIDPPRRAEDEAEKLHSIDLLIEKWKSATYRVYADAVKVSFENHYHGAVAERCIEFAEIDRIFYQITNFAVEHAANADLGISVAQVEEAASLRWVFAFHLDSGEAGKLNAVLDSGRSLFEHEYQPDSPLPAEANLSFVGEAVAHAYGLPDLIVAEKQGYIGTRVDPDRLLVWFHWPTTATV